MKTLSDYWYSVLSVLSTVALVAFFPASRVYLPWMLLAVSVIGGYNAVWNLLKERAAMLERHARELAEARRRPYTDAQRSEAEQRVRELPEQHRDALRVILLDSPISAHNVGSRLRISVDGANSLISVLHGTDFLIGTTESNQPRFSIKEQYRPILEDVLYPKAAIAGATRRP